ncbi:esterase [Dictyobacter alpinus]|uniref:Esterase n=1 Tax=Dictyobacter alpinus TaxID=2014873 RepID=A0A402BC26_9CHLR|nr:alpha/beta hydrolase [Dictyobacter alpinus]GCE28889.1 esterase [Dictyobacter alpinus]
MSTVQDRRASQIGLFILNFLKKLEAQGGPPLYSLSPTDARNVLVSVQNSVNVPKLSADIEDRTIAGGPTGEISLRIVRPQGVSAALPGVMHFHGGGWILGDKETHDRLTREIANGAQAAVVFVDYERSPEAKYPTAIEQAYAATKWVSENGASIGVDTSRLAVVGDSVGGNMATVVTMLAKERGGPKIDFQALCYPVTDANLNTESYRMFGGDGYWLTREAMKWFWDSYVPQSERDKPTVSPLQASFDQLSGLPPALIITAENDVLRDEGEAYAHKLMAAGVPVAATRYIGAIHDFLLLNPITMAPVVRAAVAQLNQTLMMYLHADQR